MLKTLIKPNCYFLLFLFSFSLVSCSNLFTVPEDEALEDEEFTSAEWELIGRLSPLPTNPPSSLTNRFADDPQAAKLGQHFFFDRRFSKQGTISCATCHSPFHAFTDVESTSLGFGRGDRNTPTILNSAYNHWQYWDGRKDSLWSQALAPLEASNEHNGSRLQYAKLIDQYYRQPYEAIFGLLPNLSDLERFPPQGKPGSKAFDQMAKSDQIMITRIFVNIGKAIEAYERKLISRNAPFDEFVAGNRDAISREAKRGVKIFIGKGECILCHDGPNFNDNDFHNLGVQGNNPQMMDSQAKFMRVPQHPIGGEKRTNAWGRFFGIEQLLQDPFNNDGIYSDNTAANQLKFLTPFEFHLGQFKTPTLRDVALTAPYSHSGRFHTLEEVIDFYNRGGDNSGFMGKKEGTIKSLNLSQEEKSNLIEFLRTLTGRPLPDELTRNPNSF